MLNTPDIEQTNPPPVIEQTASARKQERNLLFYRAELTKSLDPEIFKPNPWRLLGFGFSIVVALACAATIVQLNPIWPVKLILGVVLGLATGILAFITHELSHGSIIKNPRWQHILSFFGLIPFFLSPTYWAYSHNRLHHGKAQKLIEDPDAFPTLRIFKASKFMQFMFPYTPGSGHKRSLLYFFFWFSFHNIVAQVYMRFRNRGFDQMNHRLMTLEFVAQLMIGAAYLVYLGPSNWLWGFILPLMVQNYLLMSYIATNHNLSPLTSVNDPLANTLSVSNPRWIEFLNVNFGYHVEHHIFPTVNGVHAKVIHKQLLKDFPDDYKIMPKWKAIQALYRTPRIYKNAHQLVHPETGAVHPTLD